MKIGRQFTCVGDKVNASSGCVTALIDMMTLVLAEFSECGKRLCGKMFHFALTVIACMSNMRSTTL